MRPVTATVHIGHVMDVLKTMPAEIVHTVVTSPPYWGLRDYKLDPQVWGDGQVCQHDWEGFLRPGKTGGSNPLTSPLQSKKKTQTENFQAFGPSEQAVCVQCGAWRGSLGLEPTPDLYVQHIVEVFREVRRVLRKDGTLWLNMGDCYSNGDKGGYQNTRTASDSLQRSNLANDFIGAPNRQPQNGFKPKDLVGVPWRVAFALQADGWWLRSDIIWAKPNPMPESVTDRPTKAHEYLFLLAKSERYFYDADAIREPHAGPPVEHYGNEQADDERDISDERVRHWGLTTGGREYNPLGRNRRTVWEIPTAPYPEAHFATFPEALVLPCIQAGTSEKGVCPECGTPWERIVDEERAERAVGGTSPKHASLLQSAQKSVFVTNQLPIRQTIGWQPTCTHSADPVPATVLDPFAGSGTTLMVAAMNGRHSIGIELQPDYAALIRNRLVPLETDLVNPTTMLECRHVQQT